MRARLFVPLAMMFIVVLSPAFTPAQNAQQDAQHPEIELWPTGLPADAQPLPEQRAERLRAQNSPGRITYVDSPSLVLYPAPEDSANGCFVIVCPGGAYNWLSYTHEGTSVAEWFNTIGVSAAVLKYRVPRRSEKIHWEPLQDAQRAIRVARAHAEEWNIDPDRVGILGFSAGGNLTVMAGTHFDEETYPKVDEADDLSARPDFMMPIYAAYLGENYDDNRPALGPLVNITNQTPPTFLSVAIDDAARGAQTALLMVEFKKARVPAEAHIYSRGGHGYGLGNPRNLASSWNERAEDWMRASGLLAKPQ